MNNIRAFKDCVLETIQHHTLNEERWSQESWKNSWPYLDQNVLNDAFLQNGTVGEIFADLGNINFRPFPKLISRVKEKMVQQPGKENCFKAISDLVAGRITCQVNQIQEKIDQVREIVFKHNGRMYVKGDSRKQVYGFYSDSANMHNDIVKYVYIFLERIGYPIELQIGHEFAFHTFAIDSAIRNNPEGKVDLWNEGFYLDVKNYLLQNANGLESNITKYDIAKKAKKIHQGKVPEDLQAILEKV